MWRLALKDNVDGTQEQMGNVKEMEILRTKIMLDIKNTVKEIKNVFNRLMSRLDMAEQSISELENISIGTSKNEKQRGKKLEKTQNIQVVGWLQKV